MPDETTADDVRADETLGIDRSEQSGLGGDSVLEEYGKDTLPDDEPGDKVAAAEVGTPEDGATMEPVLPGSDPEMPKDLEAERGGPDPNLPKKGHEVREGPQEVLSDLKRKALDPGAPDDAE